MNHHLNIYIVDYPHALPSALAGIHDLFNIANQQANQELFKVELLSAAKNIRYKTHTVIFIPPCLSMQKSQFTNPEVLADIKKHHKQGAVLIAACAGVFWLATAGLLDGKSATSHWQLCQQLTDQFPAIKKVSSHDMIIDQGDIVTAAGLYAFQDLALHIMARYTGVTLARKVADFCLLDFKGRLQAYYQRFYPNHAHGDEDIIKAQHICSQHIYSQFSISQLAKQCHLSERSLLRRFKKATRYSPKQYIIQLKVEQAKQLLESHKISIEKIALKLGYSDTSNFTKIFKKIAGITPAEFRTRQNI